MKRCCAVQKVVDHSVAEFVVQWTDADGVDVLIRALPEVGTGLSNRIGNRIRARVLHLRGRWFPQKSNPSAVDTLFVKFAIVFDRQCNGSLPAFGDVYTQHNDNGVLASSFNSFVNVFNEDRFRILFEKNFTLPAIGALGALSGSSLVYSNSLSLLCFAVSIDIGQDVVFKGNSGATGDVVSGNLVTVNVCNLNVGSYPVSPWGIDLSYRLEFEDF